MRAYFFLIMKPVIGFVVMPLHHEGPRVLAMTAFLLEKIEHCLGGDLIKNLFFIYVVSGMTIQGQKNV